MFVRYTTSDGRKLQVEKIIEIEVPALEAQRPLPPDSAQAPARTDPRPVLQPYRSPIVPNNQSSISHIPTPGNQSLPSFAAPPV